MSNINESISRVRELLDYPKENSPSLHRVYGAVVRHLQHRVNELNNTGQAWMFDSETISAVDGTDEYTLTSTNFGKPIGVVTTSSDDSHFERQIPLHTMQNLIFDWDVPRNIADGYWSMDGSNHSAQRIAFYRDSGTNTVKVKIRPIPQASCTYTVYFSVGDFTDGIALSTTPLLTEHHSVFEIPAALSLLPSAKWSDDEQFNISRRKELSQSLMFELTMFEPAWKIYTSNQVHDHINMRETVFEY